MHALANNRLPRETELLSENYVRKSPNSDLTETNAQALLRGLSPELYEPLVTTLRTGGETSVHTLLVFIKEHLPRWPEGLTIDPKSLEDIAPVIVETVDRFGKLPNLAHAFRRPDMNRIAKMHALISSWYFPEFQPL